MRSNPITPGDEPNRRWHVRRPLRFGVRLLLIGVAALALLFAGVVHSIRYHHSVEVELRNSTDGPLRDVELSSGGSAVRADVLLPGESLRGRLWPEDVIVFEKTFKCDFEIRHVGRDGKKYAHKRDLPSFIFFHYEPHVRWVIHEVTSPDGSKFYATGYEGMHEKPVPEYKKRLRAWLLP